MMQTLAQTRTKTLLYMLKSKLFQQEKKYLAFLLGHNDDAEIDVTTSFTNKI